MTEKRALAYMGIDQNGKFVCAASPRMPKRDLAKELAKWVRWGLSVERCDDEFVRNNFGKIIRKEDILQECRK